MDRIKRYLKENQTELIYYTTGFVVGVALCSRVNRNIKDGLRVDGVDYFAVDRDGRERVLIFLKNGSTRSFSKHVNPK